MRAENWIKWDLQSRDDVSTKWFLSHFDDKAKYYGFFLWLVELLYQSNQHWLPFDDMTAEAIASDLGKTAWTKDEVKKTISLLVDAKLFLFDENNNFASKRVLSDCAKRGYLSDVRAEAGRKGGTKSKGSEQLPSKPEQKEAISLDKIREDKIREEKSRVDRFLKCLSGTISEHKVLNYFNKFNFNEIEMPSELDTEQCHKAMFVWLVHKLGEGKPYRSPYTFSRLLRYWKNFGDKVFCEAVAKAVRNNYPSLKEPTDEVKKAIEKSIKSIQEKD